MHSSDPGIREVSELRVRQSMEIAKELGIRGVIFHTNMIANFKDVAYMNNWVKTNATFYKKILKEYPGLYIYVENMFDFDPDMLVKLAESMKEVLRPVVSDPVKEESEKPEGLGAVTSQIMAPMYQNTNQMKEIFFEDKTGEMVSILPETKVETEKAIMPEVSEVKAEEEPEGQEETSESQSSDVPAEPETITEE